MSDGYINWSERLTVEQRKKCVKPTIELPRTDNFCSVSCMLQKRKPIKPEAQDDKEKDMQPELPLIVRSGNRFIVRKG